jgi:hypothetical protein
VPPEPFSSPFSASAPVTWCADLEADNESAMIRRQILY